MSGRGIALLAAFVNFAGLAQQNERPASQQTVIHSTTQEVLLDFIARDRHQKLITDLRGEDVEVLEDGVPQTLRSFRYFSGSDESTRQDGSPAQTDAGTSPLRQINLVSLVFERLSPETRRRAAQAARDFLTNEVDQNTYVGVFSLDHRLALLQQYTNKLELLTQAVDRAATVAHGKVVKDMEVEVTKLNGLAGDPGQFQPIRSGSAEERSPSLTDSGHADFGQLERRMAAITIEILSNQAGNLSIDALQQLIQAQAHLRGRKTVIYFSEGLAVPAEQPERLRSVVSAANRTNISFYTVDPTGLETPSTVRESHLITEALNTAGFGGSAVPPTNYRENLRDLAEDTGGFAIANTNDMRVPLRHVMEEVRGHYEVAYAPTSTNFDGHFRTIEIRVHKSGIRAQSRKGYFALPMLDGEPIAPFEFEVLTALDRQPTPHDFEFHARVLTFYTTAQVTECRAVFSVPSRVLHFTEDSNAKLFHIHVVFLALVRDDQGHLVQKISRDLPFRAPAGKRPQFERGDVIVTLRLRLPPGRYNLEAVAYDAEGNAASTRRISLVMPPAGGVLSDLVTVRNLQPAGEERDLMDPLDSSAGKITPEVNATTSKSNAAPGVYFIVYPVAGPSPNVELAVSHDGKLVSSAHLRLPPAEADGSLRVFKEIPFSRFDPGVYEITVTAVKGGSEVRRMTVIEVR
jgi:VWFA-related protein